MKFTLEVSDELAAHLRPYEAELPAIVAAGLRQWKVRDEHQVSGLKDVLEKLAELPKPEEVLALRLSESAQERVDELLAKNRSEELTAAEGREWAAFELLEHVVRRAKIRAVAKLKAPAA